MIQSMATRYGIRAVCHLAELPEGQSEQVREIAEELDIPYHYLSKILQDLARKRILLSSKGPGGGFRLGHSPSETTLYDLIAAIEGPISDDECMLGLEVCSGEVACPMHDFWKTFRATFRDRMQAISLLDVVETARKKKAAKSRLEAER